MSGPSKDRDVGCDCIDLTNQALVEHNTELGLDFQIDRETGRVSTSIALVTHLIEKKRGARAVSILATFCPFCGRCYQPDPSLAAAEPAGEVPS